jgi:branched-chain amino acid transport system permease protein
MGDLLRFTLVGVVTGAVYAIAASGLVVTYTTSGVFNFAHGAVGMIIAFVYWQLSVEADLPVWLSLLLSLLVVAPLMGLVLERVLFRRLAGAGVGVTLVVTVGLLVMLLGVGQTIWSGSEARSLPDFFPGEQFEVLGIVVRYHELAILLVGLAVAVGLRVLLFDTRIGVAMRAVVDNPGLAAQNGIIPERVSMLAWVIGTALAGISGILLAPDLTLSHIGLTLLVINGYAAAILGQLRSLPLTYGGALILGVLQSYIVGYGGRVDIGEGWLGGNSVFFELNPVLPVLFLLVVLVFLPQARLRVGRVVGAASPRVPDLATSLRRSGIFVVAAAFLSLFLSDVRLFDATSGLVFGMVMLSLVLLSGYGGQISLCQFTFVGIGALVMGKLFVDGQLVGIFAAAAITAAVGALVALPALRLQDLYLALVTFSVALFADEIVFDHPKGYDGGGNIFFESVKLGPLDLSGDRAKFLLAATGFAAFAVLVLALRRSAFGRRLAAMSDSPAAAATLGMSVLGTKVRVFALSAGMAGAAGALFGVTRGSAGTLDFNAIRSLFVFLLATIGGLTTVTGAFIGGVVFALLPVVQKEVFHGSIQLDGLFIGVGAIVISRQPNGFAGILIARFERLRGGGPRRGEPALDEGAVPAIAADDTLVDTPGAGTADAEPLVTPA